MHSESGADSGLKLDKLPEEPTFSGPVLTKPALPEPQESVSSADAWAKEAAAEILSKIELRGGTGTQEVNVQKIVDHLNMKSAKPRWKEGGSSSGVSSISGSWQEQSQR